MHRESHRDRPRSARARRTRAERVQHRRFVLCVALLALMVVVTAVSSHSCRDDASAGGSAPMSTSTTLDPKLALVSTTYTAELLGAVSSAPSPLGPVAVLTLQFDAVAQTMTYRLEITAQLADPAIAAICQGSPGENGSTVFTLFSGPSVAGDFSGVLAEGTISPGELIGPLQGADIADLALLIESGGAYASIGTNGHPIDAVRGQIE